jgi:putative nucleotidyltransferase with HDIG domain
MIPAVFHEIYSIVAVGGAVRDRLLGLKAHDVDLASSARPHEIMSWAKSKGLRYIPTGIEHGTVTILVDDVPYEHTTFRKDVSCDGRGAIVEFSDLLEEDLFRRDFTCNAIAMTPTGRIIDPLRGEKDMKDGVLRSVGNARDRFQEDYLRIIRAARFAARFRWAFAVDVCHFMEKLAPGLMTHVSVERITDEFNKAFAKPNAGEFLELLFRAGVLQQIFPEYAGADKILQNPVHHPEGDVWRHIRDTVERAEPRYRWNAFLHDVGKPKTAEPSPNGPYCRFYGHAAVGAALVREIAARMKWSIELKESVETTTALHCLPMEFAQSYGTEFPEKCCRKLRFRAGKHFEALEATVRADAGEGFSAEFGNLFREISSPVTPVLMGRHLIAAGLAPSPRMGELLRLALEIQLDEGIEDANELLRRVYCMEKERQAYLERTRDMITPEESKLGWHYCCEWDYMLVGPGMIELDACNCHPPSK